MKGRRPRREARRHRKGITGSTTTSARLGRVSSGRLQSDPPFFFLDMIPSSVPTIRP